MSLDNKGYGFMEEEIDRLKAENKIIRNENAENLAMLDANAFACGNCKLKAENEKLRKSISYIYDTCLCERFTTKGFDYHEQHPKRESNNGSSRPNTPCDFLENVFGYEWKYEKPKGVCKSWKELKV